MAGISHPTVRWLQESVANNNAKACVHFFEVDSETFLA
jgi:hypothetical protein